MNNIINIILIWLIFSCLAVIEINTVHLSRNESTLKKTQIIFLLIFAPVCLVIGLLDIMRNKIFNKKGK